VTNPEFTPRENIWSFAINGPGAGAAIDVRNRVDGFDITGTVQVEIKALQALYGEANPLRIQFVPSTIMNQADIGNELVLTAPQGYLFQNSSCLDAPLGGFKLRLTEEPPEEANALGYESTFAFPPPGVQCIPMDPENETVVIRMPDGGGLSNDQAGGLLRNNYTLEIEVLNPLSGNISADNDWSFVTRVRNPHVLPDFQRIVDANYSVAGFKLSEPVPLNLDESFALPCCSLNFLFLVSLMVAYIA
jgi:hypothetical protein